MSANKEIIESVRQKFLKHYSTNLELYHENDIKNIKENDWPIERFVLVNNGNEEKSLKAIIKAMEWRKSFGVHEFNDQYFPYELFQINAIFSSGTDKEGRAVLWILIKNIQKCAELSDLLRQFCVYEIEKLDRQTSHQGWDYFSDSSDSGLSNLDMDFNHFLIDVLQSYYPRAIKYLVSVELPWILNAASKLMVTFMNEELKTILKFIKKEELIKYLNADAIPVHLGGLNRNYESVIPKGVRKLDQMGFTAKQIQIIYSTFKSLKENE